MPSRGLTFPIADARELREALDLLRFRALCACHCSCHAGACQRPIDPDALDCAAGCRASGYLDAGCLLETRPVSAATAEGGTHV